MSFKDELKEVWVQEMNRLKGIDPEKQKELYRTQLNRITDIERQLTDLEKVELEVEEKAACQDIDERLKQQQMDDEKKDRKTRNVIEVVKVAVPAIGAFAMGLISMKWEKTDTLTSSAGKSSLRDILRFK